MTEVKVDNYKITGIIGRGGMGAIYYGEDPSLERPVAIKVVRPDLVSEKTVIERFRSEAVTTAQLNHPNIATVYELVEQNGMMFLVMEFVSGWTLAQVLRICGGLSSSQTIAIVKSALTAIAHAHKRGIIHRDLKPTNLMLNENGTIKVMDFGIARVTSGPKHTRTGQLVGTLKYMPPEQIRGKELDARTDVYALGIVIYKLLTGRVPFSAESDYQLMNAAVKNPPPPPKKFKSNISDELQAVILKALSKSADDRFADAREFIAALEACPENPRTDQAKLEELAEFMKKKHPISILPLNQQAIDMLHSSRRNSKGATNIVKSIFGNTQQKLSDLFQQSRSRSNHQRKIVIAVATAALIVGILTFLYFINIPVENKIHRSIATEGDKQSTVTDSTNKNDSELDKEQDGGATSEWQLDFGVKVKEKD